MPDATQPPPRLSPDAFAHLFREAYPALRLIASAVAGPADADDAVQQAAMVAMQRLDRFEPGTDFRAWMAAIVRGAARNTARGSRRRARRVQDLARAPDPHEARTLDAPVHAASIRPGTGGIGVALGGEIDRGLRNALEGLGHQERACLLLKIVNGNSYAEIAAMLDIPEATARSHVHRARKRLADAIGQGASRS